MDFPTIQPFYEVVKISSEYSWQLEIPSSNCPSSELLQNCDLPPPIKLFSPIRDNAMRIASHGNHQHKLDQQDDHELQRALQLSQTRARQAEEKAKESNMRTEQIKAMLLKDSLRLHAATWWMRQLEMEISLLKQQQSSEEDTMDEEVDNIAVTQCLQDLALYLGIAGAGFMFGRCILQSFPFF